MSGKVKMRCARCGKSFKSSGAKQTLCVECEAKARQERATSKMAAPKSTNVAPAPAPKIVGPGASILVPGMVVPPPPVLQEHGTLAVSVEHAGAAPGADRARPGRGAPLARAATPHGPAASAVSGHRPAQGVPAAHETTQRPPHRDAQKPQQPRAQREPKPARPATPSIELTDELRQKIEARYLELANPVEFDGIRTQIAGELSVPKALVKKAVLELRARVQMPSWWELQSYTGGNSDLERIRRAYVPHLPVPEIGIHKTIAAELGLEPGIVYQAIKRIRAEMHLPRYNPPETHTAEKPEQAEAIPQPESATEVSVSTPSV